VDNRHSLAELRASETQILFGGRAAARASRQAGWVKCWDNEQRAYPEQTTVVALHRVPRAQHPSQRNRTESHHDLRPHDLQLPVEVVRASLDLGHARGPIGRRSAQNGVGHVANPTVDSCRREESVEHPARAPDEGSTLPVLVLARSFAKNDDLSRWRAFAIDDLRSLGSQGATHAFESLATYYGERI
jgi:hypothetical protein